MAASRPLGSDGSLWRYIVAVGVVCLLAAVPFLGGLDAVSLQAINPRLIYCSITGYGQTGPLAHKAGYDFAIQAEGGLMSITGNKGEEPQKVGVAVTDLMTGVYATTAILAALHERARTGKGRVIDAALFDVQVAMLANQASNQLIGHKTPTRMGNAHPNIVPYQVFPTRDGHMVLAVGNDGQFAKFCDAAGQPAISRDARFSTNPARVEHRSGRRWWLVGLCRHRHVAGGKVRHLPEPIDDWCVHERSRARRRRERDQRRRRRLPRRAHLFLHARLRRR